MFRVQRPFIIYSAQVLLGISSMLYTFGFTSWIVSITPGGALVNYKSSLFFFFSNELKMVNKERAMRRERRRGSNCLHVSPLWLAGRC